MSKKEQFKEFAKKNPSLAKHVNNKSMTWQKFYEMWKLYGVEGNHWDEYLKREEKVETKEANDGNGFNMQEVMGLIKSIDTESLRSNIESIQKGLGVFADFIKKDAPSGSNNSYRPRARGRFFDD